MVADAPRAVAFYRDVLGLEVLGLAWDGTGAEFALPDGSTFGLWTGDEETPFVPGSSVLFAVDDLEAAVAALEAAGVPIVRRIETPVCRMALIHDTEGNIVTLHRRTSRQGPSSESRK